MGLGIWCQPYDTGKSFELYAGVRVPQFCGVVNYPPDGQWRPIPNYVAGAETFAIISDMGYIMPSMGRPSYIDYFLTSIEISGGSIRATKNPGSNASSFSARCFQILPAVPHQFGLQLINSTNLTEIYNVGTTLRPIWRGTVQINGHWPFPQIGGYDRNQYVVFANWADASVGLTSDMYGIDDQNMSYTNAQGDKLGIACGQADLYGQYEGLGHPRSVWANVVIFHPAWPEIAPSGINVLNGSGQCTWSTKYTPFLYRGSMRLTKSWGNIGVSRPMIPVHMPGRYFRASNVMYTYGIKSDGYSFAVTNVGSGYTTTGPGYVIDVINPLPVPVISADDYF